MVAVLRTACAIFLTHFQPAFLQPLFSPVVPAVVPLCKCTTYSLPFQWLSLLPLVSFFPLRARAALGRFDSGEIAFRRSFELSTSDYIASLDNTLVPSFLKISRPLRSFFPLSTGASLPFVSPHSCHSSCPSRSSFFSCSSRYSVLTSGSVRKMDIFLAF